MKKLLSSSSSSASSTISTTTTTNSFDGNFYNSKTTTTTTTAGCIAGLLRRLLCRNSLPTHPADHFREAENESVEPDQKKLKCTKLEGNIEASASGTPSVVARLMGLESLPQKSPNSIARSRSMNSVESSRNSELIQGKHQCAMSFREIPTYLELQDENFFILTFENGSKSRKMASKVRKSDKGYREIEERREENCTIYGEMKQNRENNGKNKIKRREKVFEKNNENFCNINNIEIEKPGAVVSQNSTQKVGCNAILKDRSNILPPSKKSSCENSAVGPEVKFSKPVCHKEDSEGRRIKKKRKDDHLAVKTVEPECDSQNSSPNSVLDCVEFRGNREDPNSADVSRLTSSKSRRTLWEELETYRKLNPNPRRDEILISTDRGPEASGANRVRLLQKNDYGGHKHVQMWKEICRLTERETLQSNWTRKEIWKLENYEKIIRDLEYDIVDEMVEGLVDQLAKNCNVKF